MSSQMVKTNTKFQSRAFTMFINHIYDNFHHLVHDNLQWWFRNGFFKKSAEAIGDKMYACDNGFLRRLLNLVAHFVDCNCLPTSITGGGSAEDEANAARWDTLIQEAFYNGWKSIHGIKHQTADNAYGMTIDIKGPTSLRRNDLTLLRTGDINNRMAALMEGNEDQFVILAIVLVISKVISEVILNTLIC